MGVLYIVLPWTEEAREYARSFGTLAAAVADAAATSPVEPRLPSVEEWVAAAASLTGFKTDEIQSGSDGATYLSLQKTGEEAWCAGHVAAGKADQEPFASFKGWPEAIEALVSHAAALLGAPLLVTLSSGDPPMVCAPVQP